MTVPKNQNGTYRTGYELRQAWLKSLDVGSSVTVYLPAIQQNTPSGTISRLSILASGKIVGRDRASVMVEWDTVPRITKVGITKANGVYRREADYSDPSFGLCIFPHYDAYHHYQSVMSMAHKTLRLRPSLKRLCSGSDGLPVKIGTTIAEFEGFLRSVDVCF